MKLRKEFIVHETGKESLLIPAGGAGFSGLVKGKKTFGAILELLKEDVTEEGIITAMEEHFDAPKDVITKDVRKIIDGLRGIGALDE